MVDSLANLHTSLFPQAILIKLSNIRSWRQKNQTLPVLLKRNSQLIPDKYKFLTFFALDSGEHDVDEILPFGTESGSDDFMKYEMRLVMEHLNAAQICASRYVHYTYRQEITASLIYSFYFQGSKERLRAHFKYYK